MTISVSSLFTPQTPTQWLTTILGDGASLGLAATAWQDGQPIRTILEIVALELSKEDALGISLRAQGGFLDFAASGSVTQADFDGNTVTLPVTPDPSIPSQNPTGAPGLLDTLASSVYGVERVSATAASGTVYLCNTSGVSLGTFQPGTFHTQNFRTGATYSNQALFTFSASSKIGASVTSAAGTPVTVTTSTNHGLTTGEVIFVQSLGVTADAFYSVTVLSPTTFSLNGSPVAGGSGIFNNPNPPGATCWTTLSLAFASDVLGPTGNAGVGDINQLITSAPKSFCANLVTFAGAAWQSNASLAALCRAKLATIGDGGPPGAYLAFAMLAQNVLLGQAVNTQGLVLTNPLPANVTLDGGPVTRGLVSQNSASGAVTVTVANASGPVGGVMNLSITAVTAGSPVVITTSAPHGCVTGDWGQTNGIGGVAGANGTFPLTRIDATNLSLNGSTGVGVYTSGGQFSGGDLYAVSTVLAAYAEPLAVTMLMQSAAGVPTTIVATVYVPKAFVSDYTTKMTAALQTYFTSFPIGGLNVDGQANVLPIGAIEGILYAAGQTAGQVYTLSVSGVTLNGAAVDLPLSPIGVAQLGSLAGITVVGQ